MTYITKCQKCGVSMVNAVMLNCADCLRKNLLSLGGAPFEKYMRISLGVVALQEKLRNHPINPPPFVPTEDQHRAAWLRYCLEWFTDHLVGMSLNVRDQAGWILDDVDDVGERRLYKTRTTHVTLDKYGRHHFRAALVPCNSLTPAEATRYAAEKARVDGGAPNHTPTTSPEDDELWASIITFAEFKRFWGGALSEPYAIGAACSRWIAESVYYKAYDLGYDAPAFTKSEGWILQAEYIALTKELDALMKETEENT